MSQENGERFLEAVEAFNRGDVERWLAPFDRDVVFEPQVAAMEGAYEGHDGIRAFAATIGDLYERFEVRFHDIRDLGERALTLGTASAVGKKSGIEQEQPLAIVVSFRDGRITHFKDYGSTNGALKAVGLSE